MKKRKDYVDELSPCPFCGEKVLIYTGEKRGVFIECWTCWARGPFVKRPLRPKNRKVSAAKAWNSTKRRWNRRRADQVNEVQT